MPLRSTGLAVFLFALLTTAVSGQEQPRYALVVGNASYDYFGTLKNPENDARDISAALSGLGFDVTTVLNAGYRTLFREIRDFGDQLALQPGVGLFYYAGHAIEAGGLNYLIPTDAEIHAQDEVEFAAVALDLVLSKMESAGNPTNIVVLDACRDNPLPETARSAGGSRGLSVVEAPRGSLIVYATEPGSTAADGEGRNSPFTSAFLEHVDTPGLDVELMLRNVRRDVINETGGRQTPWTNSSLTESVVLAGGEAGISVAAASQAGVQVERAVGSLQVRTRDPGDLYIDGTLVVSLRAEEQVTLNNIPAGTREIQMRFDAYQEAREVSVEQGEVREIAFTYEANPQFTLSVDPGVAGIEVRVDGRTVGRTPLEVEVAAGVRSVELRGDYIRPVSSTVSGESRETVRYAPELERLGRLQMDADLPPDAEILLDGEPVEIADTPLLPAGTYRVSVRHPTLKPNTTQVTVGYGRTATARPSLSYRTGTVVVTGVPDATVVTVGDSEVEPEGGLAQTERVVGSYSVRLQSRYGASYEETVTVEEDRRVTVAVSPAGVAFRGIPVDTRLSLNGTEVPTEGESARLALLPGDYEAVLSGEWITEDSVTVAVAAGEERSVAFTARRFGAFEVRTDEPVTLRVAGEEALEFNVDPANAAESGADWSLRWPTGDYTVRARLADDVDWTFEEKAAVSYASITTLDLSEIGYSDMFLVQQLERRQARLTTAGWLSIGTGAVGTVLGVVGYIMGRGAYADYESATDSPSVAEARARIQSAGTLVGIGGGMAGGGISLGSLLLLLRGAQPAREADTTAARPEPLEEMP